MPADPAGVATLGLPTWPRVGGGGLAPKADIPPAPPRVNPLDALRPVTDAM